MYRRPITKSLCRSLLIVFSLLLGDIVSAQNLSFSIGSYHSPKGMGIGVEFKHPDSLRTDEIYVTADLHRVLNSQVSYPGIKAVYEHNMYLLNWEGRDADYGFYIGPGLTVGYVRDQLHPIGLMTGLCADLGAQVAFDCGVSIALEFDASLALCFYEELANGNMKSSLYRGGFNRAYYPIIKIKYCFRR